MRVQGGGSAAAVAGVWRAVLCTGGEGGRGGGRQAVPWAVLVGLHITPRECREAALQQLLQVRGMLWFVCGWVCVPLHLMCSAVLCLGACMLWRAVACCDRVNWGVSPAKP